MQADEPSAAEYFPAVQSGHKTTSERVEYLPAAHAVQLLAPVRVPMFVIEPASQLIQDATFDAFEYLPASHAVHAVAPAAAPLSVTEPA